VVFRVGSYREAANFAGMADEWGIVVFPKGPSATAYTQPWGGDGYSVWVIPATYTAQEVDNIMYALYLWYYAEYLVEQELGRDTEDWKESYYAMFRDSKSVDETLVLIGSDKIVFKGMYHYYAGLRSTSIPLWWEGDYAADPAAAVESIQPQWELMLRLANGEITTEEYSEIRATLE